MILKRLKLFSSFKNKGVMDKLIEKLDFGRVSDFEVTDSIPKNDISLSGDLNSLRINIPSSMEYSQYDIDDFIRSIKPYLRTSTTPERDLYVMKINGSLTVDQCYKLVKFIIDLEGFCVIIN